MQLLKPGWQVSAVTQWGSAKVSAPTVTFVCVLRTLSPTPPQTSPWCARSETVGGVHICQKESNSILLSMTGFPCGSVVKNPPANAGDVGLIPGSGRSSGEGNGYPLQYSCLKKSHGQRSLVGYSPGGHKESDSTEHTVHTHTHTHTHTQEQFIIHQVYRNTTFFQKAKLYFSPSAFNQDSDIFWASVNKINQ